MRKTMESEYEQYDQARHMLENPERDLGDCTVHMVTRYLLNVDTMKMEKVDIPYSTVLERLFQEVLYNAVDNAERSRDENIDPGCITVQMSKDTIRIRNEGKPIPCDIQRGKNIRKPEFIFSNLLCGSSFGGNKRKVQTVGGKFGIGAKATNIFSTYFSLDIGNAVQKKRYIQTWRNNMYMSLRPDDNDSDDVKERKNKEYRSKIDPTITQYDGPSYTQVTYTVDFSRFFDEDMQYNFSGKREYPIHMAMAFAKHCADASMTGNIKVYFNSKLLDYTDDDQYLGIEKYTKQLLSTDADSLIFKSSDSICLIADTPSTGDTISFVNGVINEEGGVHVNAWRKTVFKNIISHLKPKAKGVAINEKLISSYISMILICRLPNPKYKSQTKDKVTSPKPHTSLLDIDGNQVPIDRILQWNAVQKIEEYIKRNINSITSKSDGKKKRIVDSNKLMDASNAGGKDSHKCTLLITEGDSAASFAIKGIDDGGHTGALPIKGKLLNVGNCDAIQYAANEEICELKKALGLIEGSSYDTQNSRLQLRYGRLIIITDQDKDGAHIRMLIINFFRHKYPTLLMPTIDGILPPFVYIMETPYIRVTDGKRIHSFFYEKEYYDWINEEGQSDAEIMRRSKCDVKPYKGLGSSSDMELLEAFQIGKISSPIWDEKAEDLMMIAFDKGYEDDRKEWLLSWDPYKRIGTYAKNFNPDTISYLVTNQLCEFSWVNALRSTPSIVDGLKECQRKVIAVVLGMTKAKKVSQLKGQVSDHMHYRYGDDALYRTIVGLGNYCVGTNNIPLINAQGQYDSRLGNTAAADRYISAERPTLLKYIFRKEDDCILEYQYEGKDRIEPKHYLPIIPIWAVNGSRGIGTGFSTNIPAHNPINVMQYIHWWCRTKARNVSSDPNGEYINDTYIPYQAPPEVMPYYKNYQGKIEKSGDDWYSIGSYEVVPSRKTVKDICITEIPVTQTISTYIKKLDKLKQKPIMKNWTGKEQCPKWIGSYKNVPRKQVYKYRNEKRIEVLPCIHIEYPLCITTSGKSAIRALGLIEKISDTNITLLDDKMRPRQYGGNKYHIHNSDGDKAYVVTGVMKALDHFCEIRYQAYVDRRKKMLSIWKDTIDKLELKKRFILDITTDVIKIRDEGNKIRKKELLLRDIINRGYPEEFGNISIYSLTDDGVIKTEDEINKIKIKYDAHLKLTPINIWMQELEELYNHLDL